MTDGEPSRASNVFTVVGLAALLVVVVRWSFGEKQPEPPKAEAVKPAEPAWRSGVEIWNAALREAEVSPPATVADLRRITGVRETCRPRDGQPTFVCDWSFEGDGRHFITASAEKVPGIDRGAWKLLWVYFVRDAQVVREFSLP